MNTVPRSVLRYHVLGFAVCRTGQRLTPCSPVLGLRRQSLLAFSVFPPGFVHRLVMQHRMLTGTEYTLVVQLVNGYRTTQIESGKGLPCSLVLRLRRGVLSKRSLLLGFAVFLYSL